MSSMNDTKSGKIQALVRSDQAILNNEKALLTKLREASTSGISNKTLPDIMREVKARLIADGRLR